MDQIFYNGNSGEPFYPKAALSAIAGQPVELAHDERGFRVVLPNGTDPVAPEPEEGEEPIEPAPAWASYSSDPQPDAATIAAWRPVEPETPPPAPVTDVERAAAALAARRRTREDVIFSDTAGLVATCYAWLQRECAVPGGGTDTKTASQALQAGQGLCSTQGYGLALRAWIDFAASDFYTALSSPDATRPWLEWVPVGEPKSIREAILDRVYLATYGVPRP